MSDLGRTGHVSFVSSGPGDPELLTVRAANRIKEAQVILYDDLAAGPILDLAPASAELIGVGKRAGRPSPKQHHVSQLLVDYASEGDRVVRLKSGDSGLFGRLEEEMDALDDAQIPYEIIPGGPSPLAAAAAAGIPLTRRLSARRVQFFTGADIRGILPDDANWAALADPKATTAIFMGKKSFPTLYQGLIAHGLSPDTPALIAHAVSTPDQTITRMSLGDLNTHLSQDDSTTPAMILYGPLKDRG